MIATPAELELKCKTCSHNILLPPPKGSSVPAFPKSFLCPSCSNIHEYSGDDYRPVGDMLRPPGNKPRQVVKIQLPCGHGGCPGTLVVHAVMPFDADLGSDVAQLLHRAIAHNLPCGRGHLLSGPASGGGAMAAEFDATWGRLDG